MGQDVGSGGHSLRYFGSWNTELVEADFTKDELRSFTVTKEILFESSDKQEVTRKATELIQSVRSNEP